MNDMQQFFLYKGTNPHEGGALPSLSQSTILIEKIEDFTTVAQAIFLSGKIAAPALCSGISLCGRCRMRFTQKAPLPTPQDERFFSPEDIALGWRLSCRHTPVQGMVVEVPTEGLSSKLISQKKHALPTSSSLQSESAHTHKPSTLPFPTQNPFVPVEPLKEASLLAIDLGTTSLHWAFLPRNASFFGEQKEQQTSGGYAALDNSGSGSTKNTSSAYSSAFGSMLNPQMGAGSDVISRLALSRTEAMRSRLSNLVLNVLRNLCINPPKEYAQPEALCLAGNTAMTSIAFDVDISGLSAAPYSLPLGGGEWKQLEGLPPVWVPPQLSPFVGGDISAGYAAIALATPEQKAELFLPSTESRTIEGEYSPRAEKTPSATVGAKSKNDSTSQKSMLSQRWEKYGIVDAKNVEFPFLLADMGTNGEFVLALEANKALVASVALGPALEGIGLTFGTDARVGAITGFGLSPLGLECHFFGAENAESQKNIGCACPSCTSSAFVSNTADAPLHKQSKEKKQLPGITGTGYLSLIHRLILAKALSVTGSFTNAGMLTRAFSKYAQLPPVKKPPTTEPFLPLPYGLFITATDIEEILKVKAAFSLGIERLLDHANISFACLKKIYIAGAFGRFVDTSALEALGFVPLGTTAKIKTAGNTSLLGAMLLVKNKELQEVLKQWAACVQPVDLARDEVFKSTFNAHMHFAWAAHKI